MQHSALVINALVVDRHCSATMFGVFLHCLLCCTVDRANQSLPADRSPVNRGCPCPEPPVCPPIPKQDGIGDKAPTIWLLLLTDCAAICYVCARATIITRASTNRKAAPRNNKKSSSWVEPKLSTSHAHENCEHINLMNLGHFENLDQKLWNGQAFDLFTNLTEINLEGIYWLPRHSGAT